MKKKHVVLILVVVAAAAFVLLVSKMLRDHMDHVRELEDFRVQELREWIITGRGSAYSLDRAVTEILVSADGDSLEAALEDALQQAHQAQQNLWGGRAPTHEMSRAVYGGEFLHAYESAAAYLRYLVEREADCDLDQVQIQNLELIRSYASLFFFGFDELLSGVQYETSSGECGSPQPASGGHLVIRFYPWSRIARDQGMVAVLDELGHRLRLMDSVGADDRDYLAFIDELRSGERSRYTHGLVHSGERQYSREEMQQRAESFAQAIMRGDVEAYPTVPPTGKTQAVTAEGYCSSIGEHATFSLRDAETGWRYDISVTAAGGHILLARINESVAEIGSREKALQLAEGLLAKWAAFEGVALEAVSESEREGDVRMVHAVVIDDVLLAEELVWTSVALDGSSSAVSINADRYFALCGRPGVPDPQITAAEAISRLSPRLTPTGEPRLQRRGDRLVYAIGVSGVDRVYEVYINAVGGQYEGMEYEHRGRESEDVRLTQ